MRASLPCPKRRSESERTLHAEREPFVNGLVRNIVALALVRMRAGSMPPQPSARPSAAEISVFEAWVQAGMPRATCGSATDAGAPIPNPYNTPLQCSSGRQWTGGDRESPEMHPGGACIDCHSRDDEGPRFA